MRESKEKNKSISLDSRFMELPFLLKILQWSCMALFLGRAFQFFLKSNPFGAFFYHPVFMNPIVTYIYRIDWKEYMTNPIWYDRYKTLAVVFGIFLILAALSVFFIHKIPKRILKTILHTSFGLLFFLAFCYYIHSGFRMGQFIEYASQFCMPLILFYFFTHYYLEHKFPESDSTFIFFIKIVIALTFIGHGLFALGFYPIPGHFIDMMIKGFGFTENTSKQVLFLVGVLDLFAAVLLFIPSKKIQKFSLYYIIIWGFLTALARVYANFSWSLGWYSFKQWLPEFFMRFPHFLLPLFLLLLILGSSKIKK